MESDAALERCIKHCLDCGIRFLAAPQNAGREDLRCPFGCAKRHRARQSNERVKAYRRTKGGKRKKDALNARRYRRRPSVACDSARESSSGTPPTACDGPEATDSPPAENAPPPFFVDVSVTLELDLDGVVLDESSLVNSPLLPYIRAVIRMIDGVRLSHAELVAWLRRVLRQRSMVYCPRRDYVVRFLNQHPP
ncbi:MAG: hypothetical protein ACODAD_08345 [Planctomycetota bacterium]